MDRALIRLQAMASYEEASKAPLTVQVFEDHYRLSPGLVAALDDPTAQQLGLPPATSLGLDLKSEGRIDQDEFRIAADWVRPGGGRVRAEVAGPLIATADGHRRIPEPLWSLWRAAQPLALPLAASDRFEALAALRRAWPEASGVPIESDQFLRDLRVHYASALSLKLRALTPDQTDFDPILFSAPDVRAAEEDGRAPDEDLDNVLTPSSQKLFAEDRFRRAPQGRAVYVLRDGEYIYIDPALRPVLSTVRALQNAPEAQRREFVLNPRKVLAERLDEDATPLDLNSLFVETEQFSERVAGVDVWRVAVLPWLTPTAKNTWVPEAFGLRIGETYVAVPPANVEALIDRVQTAVDQRAPTAEVGDLVQPVEGGDGPLPTTIPATHPALAAVKALEPFIAAPRPATPGVEAPEAPWKGQEKLFLVVRQNFEEVSFQAAPVDGEVVLDLPSTVQPPKRLRATLKTHQVEGLNWLASAASAKMPGVLLADDMGLGKTLQALAFMAWRQEQAEAGLRFNAPFLIVAPTGLLGNWQEEIGRHLEEPRLGRLVPAFGPDLRQLRETDTFSTKDIESGRANLSADGWAGAGVVLTTYETLRDYHFSFARTRFAAVIFDEIQKLKNPASQVTRAAQSLNAEFTIGMTGTPVENRLQDLWSIMDVIAPGLLGASREFEKRHPPTDHEALARLRKSLLEPEGARPPWMLRRLKADALEGLPQKVPHPLQAEMPGVQADPYREIVVRAAAATTAGVMGKGGMLSTLSALRGTSLHPINPLQAPADLDSYAAQSARLSQALAVLKDIASKKEKALVFVEDLAMQERLAEMIQRQFGLRAPPMRINGSVPGPRRQELVTRFQAERDQFDVMILSPKAGGVGLTITAANHVIHLSRWWNPAVEDQATDRVFRIGQTKDVHVYYPMAVHPDPHIRATSFDLRLNELIERKRALTRDLFLPSDATDEDLADLFRNVSAGGDAQAESDAGAGAMATAQTAPAATPGETQRQTLRLPEAQPRPRNTHWVAEPGQPRPRAEILSIFKSRNVEKVIIRDPYALARAPSRQAHVRFLSELKETARSVSFVEIEYAPDADGDDDGFARRDFGDGYARVVGPGGPRLALMRRPKRGRGDDFHARSLEIVTRGAGGAALAHTFWLGRGLEALYNDRFECRVAYIPPNGPD